MPSRSIRPSRRAKKERYYIAADLRRSHSISQSSALQPLRRRTLANREIISASSVKDYPISPNWSKKNKIVALHCGVNVRLFSCQQVLNRFPRVHTEQQHFSKAHCRY